MSRQEAIYLNNLIKNGVKFLLCLAVLLLTLASCGVNEANEGEAYLAFNDSLTYEVVLEEKPTRVAALVGSFADMWVLAGGELCAAPEDAFEDFGISSDGVINIGGAHSPSLELLLSAEPDFVIASASTAANLEMRDKLTSAGISVAYFNVDSFYDYLSVLDIMTSITGRRELYEQNGLRLLDEINGIKESVAKLSLDTEEKRILLLRASSGFVKAKGSEGTVLGEMLDDLGLVNIADSDKTLLEKLSAESIISEEPYRIFCVTMGNDTEAAMASLQKLLTENPLFAELSAVEEGRLHIMDKSLFNLKPNDRWAEAYGELYDILTK